MFDSGRDDMSAVWTPGEKHSLNGVVVCFGAAAGENNFIRRATEERGDLTARLFKSLLRRHACPVVARRVAVMLAQEWPHRLDHFRGDGCAGVVIKIDLSDRGGRVHTCPGRIPALLFCATRPCSGAVHGTGPAIRPWKVTALADSGILKAKSVYQSIQNRFS